VHTGPMYSDADATALYDRLNPWGPSDDFYLSFVMDAPSVLDVGCGTGRLLHRAREAGHTGRLCGVDPDVAALERARRRSGIEWVEAGAAEMAWDREFALAVMASNVFQVFVTDQELGASLAATRAALADGGRLVFGTRNPRCGRGRAGTRPTRPTSSTTPAASSGSATGSSRWPATS
jgi:SAM-dependent methyltransferase